MKYGTSGTTSQNQLKLNKFKVINVWSTKKCEKQLSLFIKYINFELIIKKNYWLQFWTAKRNSSKFLIHWKILFFSARIS